MKKYDIKYLLSPYENPKYIDYANLFDNTNMRYPSSNRRYLIFKKIGIDSNDLRVIILNLKISCVNMILIINSYWLKILGNKSLLLS
jgi:hypothetical protein